MLGGLAHLLNRPFDDAGMFPPAQLPLAEALKRYDQLEDEGWDGLVNRFLIPVSAVADMPAHAPLDVSLVADLRRDVGTDAVLRAVRHLENLGHLVDMVEVRVEPDQVQDQLRPLIGQLPDDTTLVIEVPHHVSPASVIPEWMEMAEPIGFKARCGGVTAQEFPEAAWLADFIVECVNCGVGFKFTAGLHEPLTRHDATLDRTRYGFVSVLAAGLGAITMDFSKNEVRQLLMHSRPDDYEWSDIGMKTGDLEVTVKEIDALWEYCEGIGSCSIAEPVEHLTKLGWWGGQSE